MGKAKDNVKMEEQWVEIERLTKRQKEHTRLETCREKIMPNEYCVDMDKKINCVNAKTKASLY
jgi:hypothetical protein